MSVHLVVEKIERVEVRKKLDQISQIVESFRSNKIVLLRGGGEKS